MSEQDLKKIFKDLDDMGIPYIKKDVKEKWQNYCDCFTFSSEKDALQYMTEDELNHYLDSEEFYDKAPFPSPYDFMNKHFH